MRAKVTTQQGPSHYEWIIVARWGSAGEHLSVGRTKVRATPGRTAPIHLAPRVTALARLLLLPSEAKAPTFLLTRNLPESISVAGAFAPAEGYLRLSGRGARLRLRAEGRCIGSAQHPAWRVEAARAAWVGEYIEIGTGPGA
jgi:hypothetical protein